MVQQLLWIETLLKCSGGVILTLFPLTAARLFGLPKGESGLWPRLLGAVLLGIAAAAFLEGQGNGPRGLGLGALMAINLISAAALLMLLGVGSASATRRGRAALWLLLVILLVLAGLEFLYA